MDSLKACADAYIQHLRDRNYREGSLESQETSANVFLRFLEECDITKASELRRKHVSDYQTHLYEYTDAKGNSLKPRTQLIRLSNLRTFLRYLHKHHHTGIDLAKYVQMPKTPVSLPRGVLSRDEVKAMFAQPDLSTAIGYRDRVILEVFYATGIRVAELAGLKLQDLDLEGGYLKVTRKRNKEQLLPLAKVSCRWLQCYIEDVRPALVKKDPDVLFPTRSGRPFETTGMWVSVRKYAKRAGIKKPLSSRSFRHTFATEMLRSGADIRYVQQLLGHASVTTTQIYTHVAIDDLQKVHHKAHPREREDVFRPPVKYEGPDYA